MVQVKALGKVKCDCSITLEKCVFILSIYCRDFIEKNMVDFAKEYPGIVVYVKPRRHRGPSISAEYCKLTFLVFLPGVLFFILQ